MIWLIEGNDPLSDTGYFIMIIPNARDQDDAYTQARQIISLKDREDLVDAVIDAKYTNITSNFSTVEQGNQYTKEAARGL